MTAAAGARGGLVTVMGMAFAARLPLVMVGLAMALLLRDAGFSYGVVGLVAAAYILAMGLVSPLVGRAADRLGSAPVLVVSGTVSSAALAVMAVAAADLGAAGDVALAALAGAAAPPVSPVLRASVPVLATPEQLTTVYAMEAALQEVLWVAGPLLVVLAVAAVSPQGAMLTVAAGLAVLTWAFAGVIHRRSEPGRGRGDGWALRSRALRRLVVAYGLLGVCFGATELSLIAVLDEHGHRSLSGAVMAAWAGGSLVAGLVVARRARRAPHVRLPGLLAGFALLTLPLVVLSVNPVLLSVGLFVQGLFVAPSLGTVYELVPDVVAEELLTEAFAWVASFLYAGAAAGNAAAGIAASTVGASSGFLVALAAVCGALPASLAVRGAVRAREPADATA
ncbi:MAG: MFS transporter [Thermoleophilia bacterium]|nr:MFS transporter [Thermoleophilia bacterium]